MSTLAIGHRSLCNCYSVVVVAAVAAVAVVAVAAGQLSAVGKH